MISIVPSSANNPILILCTLSVGCYGKAGLYYIINWAF